MESLFECDSLRHSLREKFSQPIFHSSLIEKLRSAEAQGKLETILERCIGLIKSQLDERPWHMTLQFCVPEVMHGKKVAPVDTQSILTILESVVDGSENNPIAQEAIFTLCPGLSAHPDTKEYMDRVILPFRSFVLVHAMANLTDGIESVMDPKQSTNNSSSSRGKGKAWSALNPHVDTDEDVLKALQLIIKNDTKGLKSAKKSAKRGNLYAFGEAYLSKDDKTMHQLAREGLCFAMLVVGHSQKNVEYVRRAAKIGDPVAHCLLGSNCETVGETVKAIGHYEDSLEASEEWGLSEKLIPWAESIGSEKFVVDRLAALQKKPSKRGQGKEGDNANGEVSLKWKLSIFFVLGIVSALMYYLLEFSPSK
eukprot:PhF_6_TR15105/c1_g1_i1/m.23782